MSRPPNLWLQNREMSFHKKNASEIPLFDEQSRPSVVEGQCAAVSSARPPTPAEAFSRQRSNTARVVPTQE